MISCEIFLCQLVKSDLPDFEIHVRCPPALIQYYFVICFSPDFQKLQLKLTLAQERKSIV